MAGLKKVFQKFSTRMDLYALFVIAFFFLMVRPVETIKDIQISGDENYLYLALGKRGIRVLDISNPGIPKEVGKYDTFNSANALAVRTQGEDEMLFVSDGKAGVLGFNVSKHVDEETKEIIDPVFKWDDNTFKTALDIVIKDKFAIVARGEAGLTLVNIDKLPPDKSKTYHWQVDGVTNAQKVLVQEDRAYVIDGDWNLKILDVHKLQDYIDNRNSIELGSFNIEVPVNDISFYGGVIYLATQGKGLVLLNVGDPANIQLIQQYEDSGTDLHSVSVYGSFAYIGAGSKGLQILDISDLGQIVRVDNTEEDDEGKVKDAQKLYFHNDYVYVGDGIDGLRTVHTKLDIETRTPETLESLGFGQQGRVIDVAVVNDKYAYVAGGERGLWVLDFSKPESPKIGDYIDRTGKYASAVVSRGNYIYVAYKDKSVGILTHGSLKQQTPPFDVEGEPQDLAIVDDRFLYVASGHAGLRVINISNFVLPQEVGSENRLGNAVGVFVLDSYAYVASAGDGLRIVNILDPTKPTLVNTIDTAGEARSVVVYRHQEANQPAKLYAYVADGSLGLVVFDVSNPYDVREVNKINESFDFVQDVAIKDKTLFVTDRSLGLMAYTLSDPENPNNVDTFDTPGQAVRITVVGNYAYVADGDRGLRIVNITNPNELKLHAKYDTPANVTDLAVEGDKAYLVDGNEGMWVVELANPEKPFSTIFVDTPGNARGLDVANGKAYIADGIKGLQVIDLTNPISPTIVGSYDKLNDVNDVKVDSTYAYLANGLNGLEIVVITDTAKITQAGHFGTQGAAFKVDVAGQYAYIVTSESRLDIAYLSNIKDPARVQPPTPFISVLKDTKNVLIQGNYAYVSDGENGLVVYNVEKPFNPALTYLVDTPGQVKDVAISGHFGFLADGTGGVQVLYFPTPDRYQEGTYYDLQTSASANIASCSPDALGIEALPRKVEEKNNQKFVHYYVYIATDQCGLKTLDFVIRVKPENLDLYITPGDATFIRVIKDYGKATLATILKVYERRSEAPVYMLPAIAREEALIHYGKIHPTVKDTAVLFLYGIFLLTIGLLFWLALIVYFVLPVRTGAEGGQTYWRLILFFRGMHGPIEFAREGSRERSDSRLLRPDRPGVARVDLNSAAVVEEYPPAWFFARRALRRLQNRRRQRGETLFQTRVVGPGMVFLRSFERIRGVVDLRPQFRSRLKVHANTRDGIELYSNAVFTGFTLGENPDVLLITYDGEQIAENLKVIIKKVPKPDNEDQEQNLLVERITDLSDELDLDDKKEAHRFIQRNRNRNVSAPIYQAPDQRRNPPFIFDPDRVFKAVSSRPFDISEGQLSEWTELPAHAAAGLYRNLIGNELFDNISQPADQREFPLMAMRGTLARQLRNRGVLSYQFIERLDGQPIKVGDVWDRDQLNAFPIQEFRTPKPLRTRGIKTRFSGFTELLPKNKAVTRHLIDYWRSEWQKDATIIEADHDLQAMRIRNLARTQAQTDLVNTLAMILGDSNYTQEALALRVLQALETAAADPDTRRLLPRDTVRILRNLRQLLLPE